MLDHEEQTFSTTGMKLVVRGFRVFHVLYPGPCSSCDRALEVGAEAYQQKRTKRITCSVCHKRRHTISSSIQGEERDEAVYRAVTCPRSECGSSKGEPCVGENFRTNGVHRYRFAAWFETL